MFTHTTKLSVLVSLLLLNVPAISQEAENKKPEIEANTTAEGINKDEVLPMERIVVTSGRHATRLLDTSQATTLVTGEELSNKSLTIPIDALRGEPGVFVQQTTPGQGIPIVRGLKGSQVLHIVDGFRLNNAFFRNAPSQYFSLLDPLNIDAVEVVRGPASTLYGSDALGGAVQVFTRRPQPTGGEAWQQGRVVARYATADDEFLGHTELQAGKGNHAFKFSATYQNVGDRRTGSGETIDVSDFTARSGSFSWVWQPSNRDELVFDLQYANQPNTNRVDALTVGFGQTEPSSITFQFEPNNRIFGKLKYSRSNPFTFADNLVIQTGFQQIIDNRRAQDVGETFETREFNQSELFGTTLQLDKQLGNHFITYGAEAYLDTVRSTRFETELDTNVGQQVASRFPDNSTFDSYAIYIHDQWQVHDRLRADFGIRYSLYDIDLASNFGTPTASLNPDDVTGNVALTFSINDQNRLVAGFSRGFRAPNIFDLGTLGERPGNRFNISNPDLTPEQVFNYELGWRFQNQAIAFEVFTFYSDINNLITSAITGDIDSTGRVIVQSENLNSSEVYGAEAGVDWIINDELSFNAIVNYVRSTEVFEDGTTTPGDRIPPLNGQIGLIWRPSNRWRIEPFIYAAADQNRLSDRDISDTRINPDGTPGFVTLNVNASWAATSDFDIRFRLENITDNSFREHGSGIDAPGINAGIEFDYRF